MNPSCKMLSKLDIKLFQSLPELPSLLPLKGKSRNSDVMTYFTKLMRDPRLVKGWVTRRGHISQFEDMNGGTSTFQENSDKYTKLFDELEETDKSALFNVF